MMSKWVLATGKLVPLKKCFEVTALRNRSQACLEFHISMNFITQLNGFGRVWLHASLNHNMAAACMHGMGHAHLRFTNSMYGTCEALPVCMVSQVEMYELSG